MSDWRTLFDDSARPLGQTEQAQALQIEPLRQEMLVPVEYAEKTMHSLMRMHDELMEEKEKRVVLVEKLSAKEQVLAELASYVAMLEKELERANAKPAPAPVTRRPPPPPRKAPPPPPVQPPAPGGRRGAPAAVDRAQPAIDAWVEWTMQEEAEPPRDEDPPSQGADERRKDGWKVW